MVNFNEVIGTESLKQRQNYGYTNTKVSSKLKLKWDNPESRNHENYQRAVNRWFCLILSVSCIIMFYHSSSDWITATLWLCVIVLVFLVFWFIYELSGMFIDLGDSIGSDLRSYFSGEN